MKKLLYILLFFISISLSGTTYYVSTTGNNGNPGTLASPWLTWQYGFSQLSAGDILVIRGGTYSVSTATSTAGGGYYNGVYVSGKNGTVGSPYTVQAYTGEVPVLDCSGITNGSTHAGIFIYGSRYWHLKGLNVTGVQQYDGAHYGIGYKISSSTYITLEQCNSYANEGPGFITRDADNEILFLNCDSYYNYDPSNTGHDADGWDVGYVTNDAIIRLTGCRSWENGDDGFDCFQGSGFTGIYYFTNCWAWRMGYIPGTGTSGGDGSGFKCGNDNLANYSITRRYYYNCIAFDNRMRGFSQEDALVKKVWYNCIAYANHSWGFSFASIDVPSDVLINNIALGNGSGSDNITMLGSRTSTTNSWDDIPAYISTADFVSVNGASLDDARQADGSLPIITFLHPATGSDIIGKGTNTGQTLDSDGVAWLSPRSLGAFETTTAPPPYTGTTFYIAQSGNNGNDGSSAHPWATLAYACSQVTTAGQTIHVNVGTITETAQSVLTKKVNIIGDGPTSIIHSHYNGTLIVGSSSPDNTDATQTISHVRFTGDYPSYTSSRPLTITGRSNVTVEYCEFANFYIDGPIFQGNSYGQPAIYCLNNKFNHNIVTNCADVNVDAFGNLRIGGQSGMKVLYNTIDETTIRPVGDRGFGIKFTQAGYNKDWEIAYNNVSVPPLGVGTWDFAMELWNMRGGIDIHDNTIQGTIDIGCNNSSGQDHIALNDAGGYGYALKFYNNNVGQSSLQTTEESGIDFERNVTGGVYVYNNYFYNLRYPIRASMNDSGEKQEDIYIYYNIVKDVGTGGRAIMLPYSTNASIGEDIYIWNNVLYEGSAMTSSSAIRLRYTTATNIHIQNNIIMGFDAYPVHLWGGTITNLTVSNNIAYGNNSNTLYNEGTTLVTPSVSAFIVDNPDFVTDGSDFHLGIGSPAIATGVDVGLLYDYAEGEVFDPPEIGAYQYGAKSSTVPDVTTTAITAITATTASGGGNVTDDGGEVVTARGVCWSTAANPTTANNKTSDGSGTGVFVSALTGLDEGLTYYVRAYATNSVGTRYGNQQVFTASATPPSGATRIVTNNGIVKSGGKLVKNK